MQVADRGPTHGARGSVTDEPGEPEYLVAEGDAPEAIAERFGRTFWQVFDADGMLVFLPPGPVRPLIAGELLRFTDLDIEDTDIWAAGPKPEYEDGPEDEAQQSAAADAVDLPDTAHPAFETRFRGDFYKDVSNEFAPFGSDEGWEAMTQVLTLGLPDDAHAGLRAVALRALPWARRDIFDLTDVRQTADSDPALIGVAFAILYVTGTIDDDGRQWLLAALHRQQQRYGNDVPEINTMIHDLTAQPG